MLLQADATDPSAWRDFWFKFGDDIETLLIYAAGIAVYGLVVNGFYQIISKRVMFAGKTVDGRVHMGGPGRGFLYLAMFPLVSLGFFLLLSSSLLFLSAGEHDPALVFTLSLAIVLAVRATAYVSEPTSHDVAKMLPLGLLGVMLVKAEVIEFLDAVRQLREIAEHLDLVALYFGIVVVVEYALRSVYLVVHAIQDKSHVKFKRRKPPAAPPRP